MVRKTDAEAAEAAEAFLVVESGRSLWMHLRGWPRAQEVGGLTPETFPLVRRFMLMRFVLKFDKRADELKRH